MSNHSTLADDIGPIFLVIIIAMIRGIAHLFAGRRNSANSR